MKEGGQGRDRDSGDEKGEEQPKGKAPGATKHGQIRDIIADALGIDEKTVDRAVKIGKAIEEHEEAGDKLTRSSSRGAGMPRAVTFPPAALGPPPIFSPAMAGRAPRPVSPPRASHASP
jgi:hypothetical protein